MVWTLLYGLAAIRPSDGEEKEMGYRQNSVERVISEAMRAERGLGNHFAIC